MEPFLYGNNTSNISTAQSDRTPHFITRLSEKNIIFTILSLGCDGYTDSVDNR